MFHILGFVLGFLTGAFGVLYLVLRSWRKQK